MFWKNVKIFKFKKISLVSKLTLMYILSTVGLLSAISIFLYPTYIKIINKSNEIQSVYFITECKEKIIFALLASSVVAVLFGFIVAKKGLSKLKEFEYKIDKINVDSLHERVNINEWPTEIQNLGIKFNIMLDRIQSVFVQMSQFSSDIAHELRTPINNLKIMTELAINDKSHNEKNIQMLEKYIIEYDYLSKLIENLMFCARSDNGQIKLNKKTFDAKKEILNICEYYQPMADERKIEIILQGGSLVYADMVLFKRAVNNLLSNALKYTLNNGKINISIKKIKSSIKVCITDTGIGIPSEHLKKIGDRFYKINDTRSQSGGLGLGLSILKSIVDLHNGHLKIESIINQGTTVSFTLPCEH